MENIQRLENRTKGEVDLNKARESAVREFNCELAEANKIWYGVLRLIITLASSFLVLTLALVEKIFPLAASQTTLPKLLILSWVLLFCAIIFGIINVRAGLEPAPTHGLPEIVRQFKTFSVKRVNQMRKISRCSVWQRNYYEHIVCDDNDLNRIREYVVNNPAKWKEDEYYGAKTKT